MEAPAAMPASYGVCQVGAVDVFFREAGPPDAPVILLLHGFPTASHMFRDLMPLLSDRYRLVAPDLPGFGQTRAPPRGQFDYTFDRLAEVIEGFTQTMSFDRYALYVFDYGAPVGLRLAMRHPERVTAIVTQNGNAYLDGFSDQWGRGKRIGGTRARPTGTPAAREYTGALPGVIVARHDLDEEVRRTLLDALLTWTPSWDALYGPFKPLYMADLHSLFHDVARLPEDILG